MIYIPHLRQHIIKPALALLPEAMRTPAAVELLIGTCLKESLVGGHTLLKQGLKTATDGRGRAMGIYQMERATYTDHLRWLKGRPLEALIFPHGARPATDLLWDWRLSTLLARIHYWNRSPHALPKLGDVEGYARTWGAVWQTQSIPEQIAQFAALYRQYALPSAPKVAWRQA